MPEERRGRLDHAIDRAVRDMVQVEPRPGLRHRVANRLAEVDASGAVWPVPFAFARRSPLLATAAALVLVLAAFVLQRQSSPRPEADMVEATPAASPVATVPSAAPVSDSAPAAGPALVTPAPRVANPTTPPIPPARDGIFGERTGRIRAASIPAGRVEAAAEAEPLDEPALPLVEGGIQPLKPITIEPIRVAPLTIRPVTLSAPSGGK